HRLGNQIKNDPQKPHGFLAAGSIATTVGRSPLIAGGSPRNHKVHHWHLSRRKETRWHPPPPLDNPSKRLWYYAADSPDHERYPGLFRGPRRTGFPSVSPLLF